MCASPPIHNHIAEDSFAIWICSRCRPKHSVEDRPGDIGVATHFVATKKLRKTSELTMVLRRSQRIRMKKRHATKDSEENEALIKELNKELKKELSASKRQPRQERRRLDKYAGTERGGLEKRNLVREQAWRWPILSRFIRTVATSTLEILQAIEG